MSIHDLSWGYIWKFEPSTVLTFIGYKQTNKHPYYRLHCLSFNKNSVMFSIFYCCGKPRSITWDQTYTKKVQIVSIIQYRGS